MVRVPTWPPRLRRLALAPQPPAPPLPSTPLFAERRNEEGWKERRVNVWIHFPTSKKEGMNEGMKEEKEERMG